MLKKILIAFILIIALIFAACGDSKDNPPNGDSKETQQTQESQKPQTQETQEPETPEAKAALTTLDVYQMFVEAGLPVGDYVEHTEETDPDNMMNKPGYYIAKLQFAITTIDQTGLELPRGGYVEIFKTNEDAKNLKNYLEELWSYIPATAGMAEIVNSVILIRTVNEITASEAQKYFDVFK
jgi:hypothetical protein